jgi:FkbM family methyltransferase
MLIRNNFARRHQRRLTRAIKRAMGLHDPYGDLITLARVTSPAAVLDIGSYVGETIVRFLDELNVPIYGFEPTPDSYNKLKERFAREPSVKVFNCALGTKNGSQRFFCNANAQTNSLLDNDEGNARSLPDYTRHVREIGVEVHSLDAWAAQHLPHGKVLIKADIQGAEGRLLDGGAETFSHRVTAFYSETQLAPMYEGQISFWRLHERLVGEFGFCLFNIYPCSHDQTGRAVQTDALWIKADAFKRYPELYSNLCRAT